MRVKDHFAMYYDPALNVRPKIGAYNPADNLHAFAPEVDFTNLDTVGSGWAKPGMWGAQNWCELFELALDTMRQSFAEEELAEPFGPPEYMIFEKIMRAGFNRFKQKHPSLRVPEVWKYAIEELGRLRDPSKPARPPWQKTRAEK